ncbi:hypothetical protein ACQP1P_13860 [Dactylosporangium sp. CA-052675]
MTLPEYFEACSRAWRTCHGRLSALDLPQLRARAAEPGRRALLPG